MATAVIRTGGKQYVVAPGDTVKVAKLSGEPGDTIEFNEILALGGENAKIGKPLVDGARVEAEILRHDRDKKLIVFKMRRRKRSRRKAGHRQDFTAVKITKVEG